MYYTRRQNKYGSVKQTYKGYSYMSKKEANKAFELDLLVKAGEVISWERQVKIPLRVNNQLICNYYVDFLVHWKDGTEEYVEIKGFKTDLWRIKWKMFEALYKDKPNIKLSVEY